MRLPGPPLALRRAWRQRRRSASEARAAYAGSHVGLSCR